MTRSGHLARAVLVLLIVQGVGCVDVHSSKDTTRASIVPRGSEAREKAGHELLTPAEQLSRTTPNAVVATPSSTSAPATDSVIARARAQLRSARPTFREWEDSSAVGLSLKDAGPVPFTSRPVVGDFDEDGTPDVAFLGRDAQGEKVVAVVSRRGHSVVVGVTADIAVPRAGPTHRRWMRLATIFTDHDQVGLEIVDRNDGGEFPLPASQYVYREGHFMQWIEGN